MSRVAPASYWILCALAEGEAHGYVIAQRKNHVVTETERRAAAVSRASRQLGLAT